jgi:hypothetical protein
VSDEVVFTYHRPISITVTRVNLMATVRDLPHETLMTANLKLGLDVQKRILEIIEKNLEKEDPDPMIALTVRGVT